MSPFQYLLCPFALLYKVATGARNKMYNAGLLKSTAFPVPIICVGNLSTGGTGKSPHVLYLAKWLGEQYKVAIISRGYGRKSSGFLEVLSHGNPSQFGDEPLELKQNLPNTLVVVDEDRVHGVRRIIKEHPEVQIILMDDGFQHRALKPTATIVLTAFDRPFSKDHILPMGNLREARLSATRADIIVLTKVPKDEPEDSIKKLKKELAAFSNAPIFTSGIQYGPLRSVFDTTRDPIDLEQVKACLLITGIAHPEPLIDHLKKHSEVREHIAWPDHHEPSRKELEKARQKFDNFAGLEHIIITTKKDAMRLLSSSNKDVVQDLPVFYLEMTVRPLEEDAFKQNIMKYVRKN